MMYQVAVVVCKWRYPLRSAYIQSVFATGEACISSIAYYDIHAWGNRFVVFFGRMLIPLLCSGSIGSTWLRPSQLLLPMLPTRNQGLFRVITCYYPLLSLNEAKKRTPYIFDIVGGLVLLIISAPPYIGFIPMDRIPRSALLLRCGAIGIRFGTLQEGHWGAMPMNLGGVMR